MQRSSRNLTDGPPATAKRSRSTGRPSEKVRAGYESDCLILPVSVSLEGFIKS